MSHSELEELAAGYVLGALEPDDEHAFQRHLEGCPTCQANVRELEAVVGELAYSAPPVDPPDTVWAGIRRQIKPEARRGAVPGPATTAAGQGGPGPGGPGEAPGGPPPRSAGGGRGRRELPGEGACPCGTSTSATRTPSSATASPPWSGRPNWPTTPPPTWWRWTTTPPPRPGPRPR